MKASERSEILLSVKGSCPLSRDPRRRGCRVRNSNSLRTGLFLGAVGSHRVLSFPLNLASQAHANRGPREGKSGGLYTPSSMRVKGLRGTFLARENPSSIQTALCAKQSSSPDSRPSTADNDGWPRRLRPGARGRWQEQPANWAERRLTFLGGERTGPPEGGRFLRSTCLNRTSASQPLRRPGCRHRHWQA